MYAVCVLGHPPCLHKRTNCVRGPCPLVLQSATAERAQARDALPNPTGDPTLVYTSKTELRTWMRPLLPRLRPQAYNGGVCPLFGFRFRFRRIGQQMLADGPLPGKRLGAAWEASLTWSPAWKLSAHTSGSRPGGAKMCTCADDHPRPLFPNQHAIDKVVAGCSLAQHTDRRRPKCPDAPKPSALRVVGTERPRLDCVRKGMQATSEMPLALPRPMLRRACTIPSMTVSPNPTAERRVGRPNMVRLPRLVTPHPPQHAANGLTTPVNNRGGDLVQWLALAAEANSSNTPPVMARTSKEN